MVQSGSVQKKPSHCACGGLGRLPSRGRFARGLIRQRWETVLARKRLDSREKQDKENTREISRWLLARHVVTSCRLAEGAVSHREHGDGKSVYQIALIIFSQPIKIMYRALLWGEAEEQKGKI